MIKILITGGGGFIASSLAEKLSRNPNHFVVIIDNLLTGSMDKVPQAPNIKFIIGDVNEFRDISGVFFSYNFDYVFHYAAMVGVKRTLENPVKVLNDLSGIRHILHLAKNTGVKRVYYSSSSEVYGEPVEYPQNEDTTPLNSRLPYAIVKNAGEAYLKSYHKEYGLEYTIFRFFNTFGAKQSKDFVISRFLDAATKNQPISIYGDGSQTRTFCYIDDNVEATTTAFEKNKYVNDVVNIGGDKEVRILDLAKAIIRVIGSSSKINHLPALTEGDMTRRMPDIAKMKQLLNRENISLEDGLAQVIKDPYFITNFH